MFMLRTSSEMLWLAKIFAELYPLWEAKMRDLMLTMQSHYFLSDFDVHFPKIVSQAIADILFFEGFCACPADHWALF
jgi:hypothetical protein